ncbi:MAG: rhodanese-like domain-containing protein [Bauldia sp.]|nr:rhodanese-like domain-containing protein [Bauldia sp.]
MLGLAVGLSGQMLAVAAAQPKDTQVAGEESAGFATLNSAQLATMLQNKDFFFVNVHIPYEGEIGGTDASVPFDKITENLDKLPPDKSAKIVLYCRSGRMSEIAARELTRLGYTHVSHLAGGMIDWENRGYAIIEK